MAHRKAGGSSKNLRDSKPKYLGVKIADGENVRSGNIILKQRGTKFLPGKNTKIGKDHTIFSIMNGIVQFSTKKRHMKFNGSKTTKKVVNVIEAK